MSGYLIDPYLMQDLGLTLGQGLEFLPFFGQYPFSASFQFSRYLLLTKIAMDLAHAGQLNNLSRTAPAQQIQYKLRF